MERFLDVSQQAPHNGAGKPVQCAEKPIPALFHRLTPVTLCSKQPSATQQRQQCCGRDVFPVVCGESSSAVLFCCRQTTQMTQRTPPVSTESAVLLDYFHYRPWPRHMSDVPPQIACITRPSHARHDVDVSATLMATNQGQAISCDRNYFGFQSP